MKLPLSLCAGLAMAGVANANPPTADVDGWNVVNTIVLPDGSVLVPVKEFNCQNKNNCYNYGVNKKTNTFAQPGRKGSGLKAKDYTDFLDPYQKKCKDRTITMEDLCAIGDKYVEWSKRDGLEPVDAANIDPKKINDIGEGFCLVALVVGCIEEPPGSGNKVIDYHWFRQNGDAKWSQKSGNGKARTTDDKGDDLTDPASLPDADNDDNADATQYDKFVTYMKYKPDGVNVQGEDVEPIVDLPPGVGRVLSATRTNVPWGWCLTDPAEIEFVKSILPQEPWPGDPPAWATGEQEFQGVTLEFGPKTVGPAAIRIRVADGIAEITQDLGMPEANSQFYQDIQLASYVLSQAPDRNQAFPCAEDETLPCPADCNGDGNLNILDFVCFQSLFQSGSDAADVNGDGNLNILDFVAFQSAFQAGCP